MRPPSDEAVEQRRPSRQWPWTDAADCRTIGGMTRLLSLLTWLVSAAGSLAVLVLVVYILLVAFKANPHNTVVKDVRIMASHVVWVFRNVFSPSGHRTRIAANYGLAAVVYLVVSRLIVRVLRIGATA
jgi:hypothetical protein